MSSVDKKTDESRLKKQYKEIIRPYLPPMWGEYEVDGFIEALFNGIYVPRIPDKYTGSDFVKALYNIHKKWLFSKIPLRNENGTMIIGWTYFPNPRARATGDKKKTEKEGTIEQLQEEVSKPLN
jgi:hypothetical protein